MNYKKAISLILAVTLTAASITGCGSTEDKETTQSATGDTTEETVKEEDSDAEEQLMNAVEAVAGSSVAKKQETVYVKTSATGAVDEITVSNWLKNEEGTASLQDSSDLQDIKNVKGKQNYTVNGIEVVWDAGGDDIYYQGTTDKQLPVDISISYSLDGKDIDPADLAGKSGHVEIKMNYTNNEVNKVMIADKEETIYTPFAVISGMLLDAGKFKNVTVSNGTVVSDGNNDVVVGMAFPGFVDSLNGSKVDDDDILSKIEDKISIPSDVTIEADVTDFELGMTLSMITSDAMGALGLDDIDTDLDTSDLTDDLDEFSDAGEDLVEGTGKLKDGVQELSDGTEDLVPGTQDLYDGIVDYTDGVVEVDDGVVKLRDGAVELDNGMTKIKDGAYTLDQGTDSLKTGAKQLLDGTQTLKSTVSEIAGSSAVAQYSLIGGALKGENASDVQRAFITALMGQGLTYDQAVGQLSDKLFLTGTTAKAIFGGIMESLGKAEAGEGVSYVDGMIAGMQSMAKSSVSGATELASGAEQLYNGADKLHDGTSELYEGADKLKSGTCSLKDGTVELYDGTQELKSHNQELIDGAEELKDGAVDLTDGIVELLDGSIELNDGMVKFDEEGIQKLTDLFDTDYDSMEQRLRAITDAGKNYKSFSGSSDDEDSSVRFIVESAAIETE